VSTTSARKGGSGASYEEVQASEEFAQLRSRFRKFVFPVTGLFLVWYFAYVLLAAFAPAFMATKVIGKINVGLILGLLQFVSTFTITTIYARWADKQFDPTAERLREHWERGEL
jgi:uncharacterized membrane protein (DUF485 family)